MNPKLLVLQLKPKNLEPALALIYQNGVTTLEEKKVGQLLELRLKIPAGLNSSSLIKNLKSQEKQHGKRVFAKIVLKILRNESWKKAYQKYLEPLDFPIFPPDASTLRIKPKGPYPKKPKKNTLIIQAQLAFGTGHHVSTQLAGYLLQKALWLRTCKAVLDLGCGTGLLAMVAYRRGLRDIWAVESDPEALRIAKANFRGNHIRGIKTFSRLSEVRRKFPLLVANLLANSLMDMKKSIKTRVRKKGSLVLSGLTYRDVPGILRAYDDFRLIQRKNQKGWSALWLEKF